MAVTHAFASAKTDSADSSLVRPSNWNDAHVVDSLVIPTTATPINYSFEVQGLTDTTSGIGIATWANSGTTHYPTIKFFHSRGTTFGSHVILNNNDYIGEIAAYGSDGSDFDAAARISFRVDGTPSAGTDMPGRIEFWTTPDATATAVEHLRIDNAGVAIFGGSAALITFDTNFGGTPFIQLLAASANGSAQGIGRFTANASAPRLNFAKSRGTAIADYTIVQSGDSLGEITFQGSDGTDFDCAAYISAAVDGTPGAGTDMPGRLMFWTTPDASATSVERLRIDNQGGIITGGVAFQTSVYGLAVSQPGSIQLNGSGTTGLLATYNATGWTTTQSPLVLLQRSKNNTIGTHTALADGDAIGGIIFAASDGTNFEEAAYIQAYADGAQANNSVPTRLGFFTNSGSTTAAERMRIDNDGHHIIQGSTTASVAPTVSQQSWFTVKGNDNSGNFSLMTVGVGANDSANNAYISAKTRAATEVATTVVANGDYLFRLLAVGADGTDWNFVGELNCRVDGVAGNNDIPTRWEFYTTPDASVTKSEALRIDNLGRSIIRNGTAVPAAGGTIGTDDMCLRFSSTANFGIFVGSGVPTVAAATGSLYLRTDGTSTTTRIYVRTDAASWANFTVSA